MTATTRSFDPTALDDTLCLALELGEGRWVLSRHRPLEGVARPGASQTPHRRTQDWVLGATRRRHG